MPSLIRPNPPQIGLCQLPGISEAAAEAVAAEAVGPSAVETGNLLWGQQITFDGQGCRPEIVFWVI